MRFNEQTAGDGIPGLMDAQNHKACMIPEALQVSDGRPSTAVVSDRDDNLLVRSVPHGLNPLENCWPLLPEVWQLGKSHTQF